MQSAWQINQMQSTWQINQMQSAWQINQMQSTWQINQMQSAWQINQSQSAWQINQMQSAWQINQMQFLSQWLSEDRNKFHIKWIKKKNESNVLCGFFCPWWKNEERYFSWTNGYHGYFYLLFEDIELKSWNKSFYESLLLKRDILKSVIART